MANYFSPLVCNQADPFLRKNTDGTYYFTATSPEYDRIELRHASSVNGIATATPKTVWKANGSGELSSHIWAPELHYIMGKWVIYFAAGERPDVWKLRPYALVCKGENPMTDEWEAPQKMLAARNDPFSFCDFSLDVTVFAHEGKYFAVWAQKVGSVSGISNLYLAELETPTRLKSVQVLLSTPDYEWERQGGFWVNEGPAVLKTKDKIYLAYSASATGACYCMGMLSAELCDDLTDPRVWKKERFPVLQTDADKKVFGPGHNCFCHGDEGETLCVLHFRDYEKIEGDPLDDHNRHTHVIKVSFDENGTPMFVLNEKELYNIPYQNR